MRHAVAPSIPALITTYGLNLGFLLFPFSRQVEHGVRPPRVHSSFKAGQPPLTLADSPLRETPWSLAPHPRRISSSEAGFEPACATHCRAHIKRRTVLASAPFFSSQGQQYDTDDENDS